jgi:hypothetical protein
MDTNGEITPTALSFFSQDAIRCLENLKGLQSKKIDPFTLWIKKI